MGAETWFAIGKFIGAVFGFASAGSGWYFFGVQVARLAVAAIAAKAMAPRLDLSQAALQKLLTVRDPVHPQRFIYGEDMVSGPVIFAQAAGTDNADLYMAIELAGHECDSLISYRLDDTNITSANFASGVEGAVNSGKLDGVAEVQYRLGTQTQTCPTLLTSNFFSLFGASTHPGLGHAYMVWKFTLTEDNDAFETGAPQNLRAKLRGRKVYDPRLDTTNGGTGAHRLNDDTTWEWSDNPALCLADFIRDEKFGMKEDDDRVDWPLVIAAADVCDATVTIPSSTQKRYTCNATFESTEKRGQVRDALLGAMLGRMVFSQGKWRMWAGAALTPDVTLTEANLAGNVTVQASAGAKERYNRVRGKFIDPSRNYVASSYPELRSSTYETQDGGEVRPLVADFLATNNAYEAQRKGIVTLKQSRQQRVVSFVGNLSCFRLQPGTVAELDLDEYGFNGEKFFISEWSMGANGIELLMLEEDDTSWTDPLVGEYVTRSATGALTFGDLGVPAPSAVSATDSAGGVLIQWTRPPPQVVSDVEVWASDDNDRNNALLVATVAGSQYFDQVSDDRTRYYWLRSVNSLGVRSAWQPNLTTTTITGASLTGGTAGLSVYTASIYIRAASAPATPTANDGEYNFSTLTLTPATGWSVEPPAADGNPLYVSVGTFSIVGISGTDTTVVWSAPAVANIDGTDGAAGSDGSSSFVALVYQRAASAPSTPAVDDGSYNFTTSTLTPPTGWSETPPATDGNPLYVTRGLFEIVGTSGTDSTVSWTTPAELVSDGVDGATGGDGNSIFFASIFRRAASPPTTPTGGSYVFDTKTLNAPTNWSDTPPANDGNPLYISTSIAEINGTSGTDSTLTWSAPSELVTDGADGAQGDPGADGTSSLVALVYIRAASAPATPTADDGEYNFTTQTLTPPTGWSATPPAADGNPVYVSRGIFEIAGTTGTDSTVVWTAPALLVSDGVDGDPGADGNSVYFASIYRRLDGEPGTPTGGSYNFTTQTLTAPSLWFSVPPDTNGDPLWVCTAIAEISGVTGTDFTLSWSTPAVLVSDGADGAAGGDGNSVFYASAFKRSASAPATPTGGSYNFTTKTLTPPATWSATPPASDGNPLYITNTVAEINGTTGTDSTLTWTAPAQLVSDGTDGSNGTDPIVSSLTNPAVSVPTASDGTGYSYTGTGGTHKVYEGATDVTTSATHSVSGAATKNGLTISVGAATGVYTLSGASWTSNSESFTLRAVYGGVTMDKVYTISKSKAGADGSGGATIGDINDFAISDNDVLGDFDGTWAVAFKVDNDGDLYKRIGDAGTWLSITTWIGDGAASDYEVKVSKNGQGRTTLGAASNLSIGTLDTWQVCSTDRIYEVSQSVVSQVGGYYTVQWRRVSDNITVANVNADLYAIEGP